MIVSAEAGNSQLHAQQEVVGLSYKGSESAFSPSGLLGHVPRADWKLQVQVGRLPYRQEGLA